MLIEKNLQYNVVDDNQQLQKFAWSAVESNSTVSRTMQKCVPGRVCFFSVAYEAFIPLEKHRLFRDYKTHEFTTHQSYT